MPTAPKSDDLEAWENISRSRHSVIKTSQSGDLGHEMVNGRKTFYISTQDRLVNMEQAANEKQDPFRNGQFSPVRLLDGTEDAEEIAANPNLIGEAEMTKVVKGAVGKLREKLDEIDNRIVVERMLEIATEADTTVSKINAIEKRLEQLKPSSAQHVERVA